MKRLGFLGGTFNPIHYGHLRLAEEARAQFALDQLIFIPNHHPPHRDPNAEPILEGEKRYCMAVLATLQNPSFQVSELELKRPGPSYTYDTALELKKKEPNSQLYFVCGADTLVHHAWHRFPELLKLLDGFLVSARGNEGPVQAIEQFESNSVKFASKLGKIQMTPVEISATEIRERIRQGQTIRNLTPDPVVDYIERYQLYR